MPLPKEFSLPESPGADFSIALNLRLIYNMTIAHMDGELHHDRAVFLNHRLPNMFDFESSMQALAICFEQAQWWCQQHNIPMEAFLAKQAMNDEQRKQVVAMIELGTDALEKYPPTPEDHTSIGPMTQNQFH